MSPYSPGRLVSERGEAARDGASLQKNSGRGPYAKGDALWRGFVVDYKEYPKGFRITADMWSKICMDQLRVDRDASPVLKLVMDGGNRKVRLAVIEWEVLEALLDGRD
jgi:hypothetical protein